MIYTLTLNPALDKTVALPAFAVDQVNRVTSVRLDPGGKGINVSKMIAGLGGASLAIAALGGSAGQQWKQLAEGCGFPVKEISASGETRTNLKIVDPVNHTNTDINEPGAAIDDNELEELCQWLRQTLNAEDILVLSGSVPATVDQDIYGRLTALCNECGARAFVDAEGPLLAAALRSGPYLVKPNHHELSAYVGYPLRSVEEMVRGAEQMLRDGAGHVLVSMGEEGALLCWHESEDQLCRLYASAPQVAVASTVGAGDSMVGAFAYGLETGLSRQELLCLAVAAGTAAVTVDGSQAPDVQMVHELRHFVRVYRIAD